MTGSSASEEFDGTLSVSELCEGVRGELRRAFGSVWVAGEVQRLRPNRNGHLFFELIEHGDEDGDAIVAKLEAVIWRRDYQQVQRALAQSGQELVEGGEIRCRAMVDFYPPFGRTQLTVREIDTVFSLGQLAARRQRTLKALAAAGLLEANRGLALADLPLSIALVTSRESAAYHDFLSTLRESGLGFRVTLIDAAMQGRDAERAIATALESVSALASSSQAVDACVLIRGGGSKTDLAAFDSRRVAEAVARCRVPVLTGLGHQIDESIADKVSHQAFKTPTKVAEFLVGRVLDADRRHRELAARLVRAVDSRLEHGRRRLAQGERGIAAVELRLATAGDRLQRVGESLARIAGRRPPAAREALARVSAALARRLPDLLARRDRRSAETARAIARAADHRLKTLSATLGGWQRLAEQLAPERVLARGFSITRDAGGRTLRSADGVEPGTLVNTQLAVGSIRSRVEE